MKRYLLPLILTLLLIFSANCFATAWDVSTATYADKSKYVGVHPSSWFFGVSFKPDGTKMYIVGVDYTRIYQYSLSTAWDVSTATYDEKYRSIGGNDYWSMDVFFKSDGLKMYTIGEEFDRVSQFLLSVAWDVDTAVYDRNVYVGSEDASPMGVFFKPDGLKMYVAGGAGDNILQYSLSTAWNVSTASYEDKYKHVRDQEGAQDVFFRSDGLKMYVVGSANDSVHQYSLSTAWEVDTATYENKSKYLGSEDTAPFSVFFKSDDGTKMYIMGYANETVYQYSLLLPSSPINVDATDGNHTDKVVITWTKSDGATGYQVYRNATPLGWLGDVTTYDDTGADAPTITAGTAFASDGTSANHVTLSIAGESANNGTTHTYKVKARNAEGESGDSDTNTGYRGVDSLTYQWQRSAADSDADYSNIDGATTDPYNDTGAPANGDGRYYKCVENATGATQQTTNADRGYRDVRVEAKSFFFGTTF